MRQWPAAASGRPQPGGGLGLFPPFCRTEVTPWTRSTAAGGPDERRPGCGLGAPRDSVWPGVALGGLVWPISARDSPCEQLAVQSRSSVALVYAPWGHVRETPQAVGTPGILRLLASSPCSPGLGAPSQLPREHGGCPLGLWPPEVQRSQQETWGSSMAVLCHLPDRVGVAWPWEHGERHASKVAVALDPSFPGGERESAAPRAPVQVKAVGLLSPGRRRPLPVHTQGPRRAQHWRGRGGWLWHEHV